MITWNQWLNWASLKLTNSTSPRRDAEIILGKTINKSRIQLLAFGESTLDYKKIKKLKFLINRRKRGEPIAYLIKSKEFWSLNFIVSIGAFIPRPETECLIEQVLYLFNQNTLKVLDLGTGIGTIALSIASERPKWKIIGVDQQKTALTLAHKNKLSFNLKNVNFFYSNWFKNLKNKKFHLIISNPPYINEHDLRWITNDIFFEPRSALISSRKGLEDLMIICRNSVNYLYPYGWLFVEHGWNQGKHVRKFFYASGFNNIHTIFDYQCYERITYGQWVPIINHST